jgi:hypothetical protein
MLAHNVDRCNAGRLNESLLSKFRSDRWASLDHALDFDCAVPVGHERGRQLKRTYLPFPREAWPIHFLVGGLSIVQLFNHPSEMTDPPVEFSAFRTLAVRIKTVSVLLFVSELMAVNVHKCT